MAFLQHCWVLSLQISPKKLFSTLQIFPPAVEIASRPGCRNRPDSTRKRHPYAQRGSFFGTRFLGEFLSTPPVEADPRGEYNFLGMASNGPVEQIIFLQKVGSVFEHFLSSKSSFFLKIKHFYGEDWGELVEFMERFQHQIMYVLFLKRLYTKELSKFLITKGAFEDVSENSAWNGKNLVALSNPQVCFSSITLRSGLLSHGLWSNKKAQSERSVRWPFGERRANSGIWVSWQFPSFLQSHQKMPQ